jgi:hypothetical protein
LIGKKVRKLYLEVITTFVCNFSSNGSIGVPMVKERTPGEGAREKEDWRGPVAAIETKEDHA